MRVLYVEAAYGFGGSLTGLLHLFRHLPEEVEPFLVTAFDPTSFVELPQGLAHRIVAIKPEGGPARNAIHGAWRYYRDRVRGWARALDPIVREFRPDVIHANNSVTINLGASVAGRRHAVPTLSHQKHYEYDSRLTRWIVRNSGFTHHLATSGAVADRLIRLGLNPRKCTTIYEPTIGPAPSQLEPARAERRGPPVVAMHSMINEWKGQHVFLEAIARLRERNGPEVRPVIAGAPPAGEQPYLDRLRQMTQDLGLEDTVEFVGHQRDVYDFLRGVDIAVHGAVEPEPFGRVVAEAMLAAAPTIVTSDGGPAEYVTHQRTGLIVPRGDAGAMADAIGRLAADPDLRARLGAAGREFAVRAFDPDRLAAELVEIYRRARDREPIRTTSSNTAA